MDLGEYFVSIIFWGLYAGCSYVLLAIGLNLIFGVMKVVNFAHGEFLMLAAYLTYWMYTFSGVNPYLVVPATMLIMALLGVVVERLCFRPILGTGKLNEIFLSLGLIYVFQNTVAFLWSANSRSVKTPFEGSALSFGSVLLTFDHVILIIATAVLLLLFYLFMQKTSAGRAMRATSQNREAASLMGVDVEKVDMLAFALGSALAAAAGSLCIISGDIATPYMGSIQAIKAFAVVIIGGLGSIPGAVAAGLLLGLAENVVPSILGFVFPGASFTAWEDSIAFFLLIAVLLVKPTGLFGERGE